MIPTHSIVQVTLSRKVAQEERTFVKSMPSSKKLYDAEVAKRVEGLDQKERCDVEKAEKARLHDMMDLHLRRIVAKLDAYKQVKDTSGFWRTWAKSVEAAWLYF